WTNWEDEYNTSIQGEFKVKASNPIKLVTANPLNFADALTKDKINKQILTLTIDDPDNSLQDSDITNLLIEIQDGENTNATARITSNTFTNVNGKKTINIEIDNPRFDSEYRITKLEFNNKVALAAFDIQDQASTNKLITSDVRISNPKLTLSEINPLSEITKTVNNATVKTRKLQFTYDVNGINANAFNDVKMVAHFTDDDNNDHYLDVVFDAANNRLTLENGDTQGILLGNTTYRLHEIYYSSVPAFDKTNAQTNAKFARRFQLQNSIQKTSVKTSVSPLRLIKSDLSNVLQPYTTKTIILYFQDEDHVLSKNNNSLILKWKFANQTEIKELPIDSNNIELGATTIAKNVTYNDLTKITIVVENDEFNIQTQFQKFKFTNPIKALGGLVEYTLKASEGNSNLYYTFGHNPVFNGNDISTNSIDSTQNHELSISYKHRNIDVNTVYEQAKYTQEFGSNTNETNSLVEMRITHDNIALFGNNLTGNRKIILNNLVPNRKYSNLQYYVYSNITTKEHEKQIQSSDISSYNKYANFSTQAGQTSAELIETKQENNKLKVKYRISSEDQLWVPLAKIAASAANDNDKPKFKVTLTPKNRQNNQSYVFVGTDVITNDKIQSNQNEYIVEFSFDIVDYDFNWANLTDNEVKNKVEEGQNYDISLQLDYDLTTNLPNELNITSYSETQDKRNRPILLKTVDQSVATSPFNFSAISWTGETDKTKALDNTNSDLTIQLTIDRYPKALYNKKLKLKFKDDLNNQIETALVDLTFNTISTKDEKLMHSFSLSTATLANLKQNRHYTLVNIYDENGDIVNDAQNNNSIINDLLKFYIKPNTSVSFSANPIFDQNSSNLDQSVVTLAYTDPSDVIQTNDSANNNLKITIVNETTNQEQTIFGTIKPNKQIKFIIPGAKVDHNYKIKQIEFVNKPSLAVEPINTTDNNNLLSGNEASIGSNDLKITNVTKEASYNISSNINASYDLTNTRFNDSDAKFRALYKDLNGNYILSEIATKDQTNNKINIEIDKTKVKSNNKLILEKIFVGKENKITNLENQTDYDNLDLAKLNLTDLSQDNKELIISPVETQVSLNQEYTSTVNNATIKLNLTTSDGFFDKTLADGNNAKVKLKIKNSETNVVSEKEVTLIPTDANNATVEFSFDGLDEGTTYLIEELSYQFNNDEFNNLKIHQMPQINQSIKAVNNQDAFNSFETKEHPYNINKFYLEVDNTKTETVAND
uniref:hypothetical protein n=1 Tax=[Mycoplasma] collis TaxID=2127 RepID=UPI00051C1183